MSDDGPVLSFDDVPLRKTKISYPSSKGDVDINAIIWEPDNANGGPEPRGIVQLVHGMVEFIDRYDEYARTLAANGFIVVGNDHVGHGDSVNSNDEWGYIPLKAGDKILVNDVDKLRDIIQGEYGHELPYFIHGHSMGSFIVRSYITKHGDGLAGAIIEGTGNPAPSVSKFGKFLTSLIAKFRGPEYRSNMVDNIALGGYSKAIPNARTTADWISRDEKVVDAYLAEPRCTFKFSVSAYHAMMTLTAEVAQQESVNRIPKDLPVLIESGSEDPVGENGKGPKQLYDMCKAAGIEDLSLKLYEGARHELHNEINKDEVKRDNISWLIAHLD